MDTGKPVKFKKQNSENSVQIPCENKYLDIT